MFERKTWEPLDAGKPPAKPSTAMPGSQTATEIVKTKKPSDKAEKRSGDSGWEFCIGPYEVFVR